MSQEYDVLIIGAGPGGYVCAIRAAQLGLKVGIVEKRYWGGVCLNVGCIPSKALLRTAEIAHTLQHRGKEFGFTVEGLALDFGAAHKRSRQVSSRLVKGVGLLMKKNAIDTYDGWATIQNPQTVRVALNDGGEATLTARSLVIATGAHPRTLPGVPLDGAVVMDYEAAILSDMLPGRVVIVGAGPIGLEFGYVWRNYGAVVTIVEMLDRPAPLEDPDASAVLARAYKKLGIPIMTGAGVEQVEVTGSAARVHAAGEVLEADRVLMAIGFGPNTEGYGLENLGVALTERGGFIQVDEGMCTSVPGVYAIGDVTGKLMLAHVGSAMGIVCAETIAGHETITLDYKMIPRGIYSQPQIASFGYTEAEAREAGHADLTAAQFPFQANGKALGLGDYEGFVKLIAEASSGRLLGAHLVGPDVTELLPELTLAHTANLTAEAIARNVHAHPTLSEALMEAAHGVVGPYIHL
jgi:dihydrolipoamide dehydrogenase